MDMINNIIKMKNSPRKLLFLTVAVAALFGYLSHSPVIPSSSFL
jgi:hypothetical protein